MLHERLEERTTFIVVAVVGLCIRWHDCWYSTVYSMIRSDKHTHTTLTKSRYYAWCEQLAKRECSVRISSRVRTRTPSRFARHRQEFHKIPTDITYDARITVSIILGTVQTTDSTARTVPSTRTVWYSYVPGHTSHLFECHKYPDIDVKQVSIQKLKHTYIV